MDQNTLPAGKALSISQAAWDEMRRHRVRFAGAVGLPVVIDLGALWLFGTDAGPEILISPWIVLLGWYVITSVAVRERFWHEVASYKGWRYQGADDLSDEEALFLNEGHARHIQNEIVGTYGTVPVRVFESAYTIGYGKSSRVYMYTAFGFRFEGTFPHAYLNRVDNGYNLVPRSIDHVPLSPELEKKFQLYVPKKYEIEALAMFSEDTLAYLLARNWPHDIELVDHEMIIFRSGYVNTFTTFESEFEKACGLVDHMKDELDAITFTPIGNLPYLLRDVVKLDS